MTLAKGLVRRFAAMLETGDLAEFDALTTADFALCGPTVLKPMPRADVRAAIEEMAGCFEQRSYRIDELLVEGDRVMARYTISGTQRAPYMGIASQGRRFTMAGVSVYRVAAGRSQEEWELVDRKAFAVQLGASA
jgi:steroid delta-isomerase-like uncharacterized protein